MQPPTLLIITRIECHAVIEHLGRKEERLLRDRLKIDNLAIDRWIRKIKRSFQAKSRRERESEEEKQLE